MGIDDHALPAVAHLTGAGAGDVLRAAVAVAGGVLRDWRASQIQYRPNQDLVVRYRCDIDWPDGRRERDTLLAATGAAGTLPGAVPVVARTDEGELAVSVWRWPFDPVLPGLPTAVTTEYLVDHLGRLGVDTGPPPHQLEVVAYRPTERAVVRLRSATGGAVYVKVVPPAVAGPLAHRHAALTGAGAPVPRALAVDDDAGLLILAELAGTTLRDRVKQGLPDWPDPERFLAVLDQLGTVQVDDLAPIAGRLRDALGHAELLRIVAPEHDLVLSGIVAAVEQELPASEGRSGAVVHGDLHEAQLIVSGGAITGLLDIDDVGLGDPVTDMATLVGHLRFRALVSDEPASAPALLEYADRLRAAFASRVGARELDVAVAGVLVGLATGPFRIQRTGWRNQIATVLSDAAALAGTGTQADERVLTSASRPAQVRTPQ